MRPRSHLLPLLACLFFFLAGQLFVPLLGIEDDESLFAAPLLAPRTWHFLIHIGHSRLPLMVMSYIGTLKTLLYSRIFRLFRPGVWSTREPMLLAGAASIWIFYALLRRTAGPRAALAGALLLATDSCYLLTTCFDWGPVALQHLLIAGGVLLIVRFAEQPKTPSSARSLAAGFFLLGLAVWDKALAVWMISGMAVAAGALFGPTIVRLLTPRRAAIAVLSFALGALPLIVFNASTDWSTFRGNMQRDTGSIPAKVRMLAGTVTGEGLFGYLTLEDWETPRPRAPQSAMARAAAYLSHAAGEPRRGLMLYALVLALVLAPVVSPAGRRAIAFCVIAGTIAWVQMAVTANTGASVHHTILLWPLPQWIVAVSFAGAAGRLGRFARPAFAAALVLLAGANLLVLDEYQVKMARNGGSVSWSDAIFPLTRRLEAARAPAIFCVDWGIQDSLRLLGRGRLVTWDLTGPLTNPSVLTVSEYLYVGRTAALEMFPGNAARLAAAAQAAGYRRDVVERIPDSYGRPTFEIYRFLR